MRSKPTLGCGINVLPSNVSIGKANEESIFELLKKKNPGVRDNIEFFGGDPGNVVAVGQSVGAMAIGLHLVSYSGTQGVPFQKAM